MSAAQGAWILYGANGYTGELTARMVIRYFSTGRPALCQALRPPVML
jgi:short subunit dehydrogenase-like uncharacterized protein